MATKEFKFEEYKPTEGQLQAQAGLDKTLANEPSAYQSKWQGQINDTINEIINRKPFSYDLNGDALYQQYKDKYTTQGKMAMMDTMGQAQAMTGGYGNSYAQSVGQQAYQGQLQQLNDKIPELYNLALSKYQMEDDRLNNRYGILSNQESQDYGKYRDTVSDWQTDRDYYTNLRDSERNYGYTKHTNDQNFAYGQYRDDIADQQWQTELDEKARQYDTSLAYQKEQDAAAANAAAASAFKKATFSHVDDTGNYVFYIDGKEHTYAPGVNPYTGTTNSDTKYGTFSNGYQPDNINNIKLHKSGKTIDVNGVTQNVWKFNGQDDDGSRWYWDGTKGRYFQLTDKQLKELVN